MAVIINSIFASVEVRPNTTNNRDCQMASRCLTARIPTHEFTKEYYETCDVCRDMLGLEKEIYVLRSQFDFCQSCLFAHGVYSAPNPH